MQFFKMHNQGNDYIFLFEKPSRSQIVRLCDRNFGIGGDGVEIFIIRMGFTVTKFIIKTVRALAFAVVSH